jgi:hypothetical protein
METLEIGVMLNPAKSGRSAFHKPNRLGYHYRADRIAGPEIANRHLSDGSWSGL